MEKQVSTITPADTGTMMLPGAAAGALGFTVANIGKQLLANKFKGYGHLATSSLASAGFGALVGGLGGSFVKKKPRSTSIQAAYNNEMNNNYINKQARISLPVAAAGFGAAGIGGAYLSRKYNDYEADRQWDRQRARTERLKKEAGIKTKLRRYYDLVSGKAYNQANRRLASAELLRDASLNDVTMWSSKLKKEYGEAAKPFDPGFKTTTELLNKSQKSADKWSRLADKFQKHKDLIKSKTNTARLATLGGIAGVGGIGAGVHMYRKRTMGQEKQAGIVSGVKGFARDLLGTDVKRYTRRADLINRVAERVANADIYSIKRMGRVGDAAVRNANYLEEAVARMGKARRIAGTSAGISLGVGTGYALGSRKREKTANMEKQAGWTSFKQGLKMMKDSVLKDRSWRAFKGSAKFTGTQIKNDVGGVVQRYKPKFLKNTPSTSETANTAASTASTASTAPNKSFIQRHLVGTAVGALGAGYLAGHMLAPKPQNNQPEKVAGVGNILTTYARKNPIETAFLGAGAAGLAANAYARRNGTPVEFSSEANPYSANFKSNLTQYLKHGISGDVLRLTGKFIKKEHPILGAISNNAGRGLRGLATIDATKGLYNAYKAVKYNPLTRNRD